MFLKPVWKWLLSQASVNTFRSSRSITSQCRSGTRPTISQVNRVRPLSNAVGASGMSSVAEMPPSSVLRPGTSSSIGTSRGSPSRSTVACRRIIDRKATAATSARDSWANRIPTPIVIMATMRIPAAGSPATNDDPARMANSMTRVDHRPGQHVDQRFAAVCREHVGPTSPAPAELRPSRARAAPRRHSRAHAPDRCGPHRPRPVTRARVTIANGWWPLQFTSTTQIWCRVRAADRKGILGRVLWYDCELAP